MANNPLYPGYSPERPGETPINPLYPGFYPGKTIQKKRFPKGMKVGPIPDFGLTKITDAYFDEFAETMENTINLPKWYIQRSADDFKQSLKINALPPEGVDREKLDDYDTGVIPGGGYVTLNIDPREWKKQGVGKMAKKTLTSWAKSAIDFRDFVTMARDQYWSELVLPKNGPPSDLALNNLGVYSKGTPETLGEALGSVDVYAKTGQKLVEFYRNSPNAFSRDKNYHEFLDSSFDAITAELKQKKAYQLKKIGAGPKGEDVYVWDTGNVAVDEALTRIEAVQKMRSLGTSRDKTGPVLKKALDADINDWTLPKVKKQLIGFKKDVDRSVGAWTPQAKALIKSRYGDAVAEEYERHLFNLRDSVNSLQYNHILNTTSVSGVVEELYIIEDCKNLVGRLRGSAGIGGFGIAIRDLTGGDELVPGLIYQLENSLANELIDPDSELGKFLTSRAAGLTGAQRLITHIQRAKFERDYEATKTVMGHEPSTFLERYLWTNHIGRIGNSRYSILRPQDWVAYGLSHVQNLGLVLDEEQLKNKGFYKRGSADYINAPNFFYGNRFKLNFSAYGKGYSANVWGGEHFAAVNDLSKWLNAKWAVKDPITGAVTMVQLSDGHITQLLCNGQKLFTGAVFPVTPDEIQKFVSTLTITQNASGAWVIKTPLGVDISINGVFADLDLLSGCKDIDDVTKRLEELLNLQANIEKFREYVIQNVFQKIPGLDRLDPGVWKQIVKQLDAVNSIEQITRRYLGPLEKIGKLINKTQAVLLNKIPVISPILKLVAKQVNKFNMKVNGALAKVRTGVTTFIQKTLTNQISAWIKNLILKASLKGLIKTMLQFLAFLTDAIAPIIGHLVAIFLAWLIDKAFGFVKAMYKMLVALSKGELLKVEEMFEESYEKKVVKPTLFFYFAIVLVVMLFGVLIGNFGNLLWSPSDVGATDVTNGIAMNVLSTFSPIDRTRQYGSLLQDFDWNLYIGSTQSGLPPTGADWGIAAPWYPSGGSPGAGGPTTINPDLIGNSEKCFKIVNPWPADEEAIILGAVKNLDPVYAAKLCSEGDIYFTRVVDHPYCQGYYYESPDNLIEFRGSCNIYKDPAFMLYLVAHELGHVYHTKFGIPNSNYFTSISSTPENGGEGTMTTYPITLAGAPKCSNHIYLAEDFAETIADWHAIPGHCGSKPNYWDAYPLHKAYVETYIFQ